MRRTKAEDGQAVFELAFLSPLLILVIFLVVALGDALNAHLTVVTVARDGARLGAQRLSTDAAIVNLVQTESARLRGTIPSTCVSGQTGICITRQTTPTPNSVTVTVCYDHPLIVPLPSGVGTMRMCSRTTTRSVT